MQISTTLHIFVVEKWMNDKINDILNSYSFLVFFSLLAKTDCVSLCQTSSSTSTSFYSINQLCLIGEWPDWNRKNQKKFLTIFVEIFFCFEMYVLQFFIIVVVLFFIFCSVQFTNIFFVHKEKNRQKSKQKQKNTSSGL